MTAQPQHIKEPAWLLAKIDQRIALFTDRMPEDLVKPYGIVMTPLTEPRPGATVEEMERWERTCDNCDIYVPEGQVFYTGHSSRVIHGKQAIVTFGACARCAAL